MGNTPSEVSKDYFLKRIVKNTWKMLPSSARGKVSYRLKVRIRKIITSVYKANFWESAHKPDDTTRKLEDVSRRLADMQSKIVNITHNCHNVADEILRVIEQVSDPSKELIDVASLVVRLNPSSAFIDSVLRIGENSFDLESKRLLLDRVTYRLEQLGLGKDSSELKALRRSDLYLLSVLNNIPAHSSRKFSYDNNKLLYVIDSSLPYSSNGYATRSHGVIAGFQSTDLDVVTYTRAGYPKDIGNIENLEAVQAFDEFDGVRYHRIESPTLRSHFGRDYILEAAKSIQAVIETERPAYVMAASNYRNALPALMAAREMGLPYIYEVRGFWEITRASRDLVFKDSANFRTEVALESKAAQEADLVLTLNSGMKAELIRRGVSSDKIRLLPNSVEPSLFSPLERDAVLAKELDIPDGIPVIGYIGTFVDYEGLDDLARACALLKEQGVEFRLLLVGNDNPSSLSLSGSVAELIRKCAEAGGFPDWLIMPGRVPFDRVRDYYSLIDIAPFPRKPWEVCELVSPLKPLESMMMAKAVIVSNVAALKDIVVHGETGFLFEKGNIHDLARYIKKFISHEALRYSIGENARTWVNNYRTWEYSVSQVYDAIKSLDSNQPPGNRHLNGASAHF